MLNVVMGDTSEDTLTTLAGRLTRLDKQLTPTEQTRFAETSGGLTIADIAKSILNAFDEDYIEQSGKPVRNWRRRRPRRSTTPDSVILSRPPAKRTTRLLTPSTLIL
jgi:hypothetical protein